MPKAPPTSRSSRRRPRPRPASLIKSEDAKQRNSSPNWNHLDLLTEALSVSGKTQIDMLLERRQLEEPTNEGPDAASPDPDELAEAYTDMYGRPPPDVARSEERLAALEKEVGRLPLNEREALTEAMTEHPLLFVNCPHTKMILEQDSGEDGQEEFDPAAAARRLARYWEQRRSLFGDQACYAPGNFQRDTFSAYKRLYARTVAVANDPDADDEARKKADNFLEVVHDIKVQALNTMLDRELDEGQVHCRESLLLASQSPDDLKLQFLRAEDFNETKAMERLIFYWKISLELFGHNFRFWKSIRLGEIEDCSVLLGLRQVRLMPKEDGCGRSVLLFRQLVGNDEGGESNDYLSIRKMVSLGLNEIQFAKVLWYFLQASMERESCRLNGYVLIVDLRIKNTHFNEFKPFRQAFANVINCFPVRLRAIHFILGPDLSWWQRINIFMSALGVSLSRRFAIYAGAADDIIAKLSKDFRIKSDNLPEDLGGTVDEKYFSSWLEERRAAGL